MEYLATIPEDAFEDSHVDDSPSTLAPFVVRNVTKAKTVSPHAGDGKHAGPTTILTRYPMEAVHYGYHSSLSRSRPLKKLPVIIEEGSSLDSHSSSEDLGVQSTQHPAPPNCQADWTSLTESMSPTTASAKTEESSSVEQKKLASSSTVEVNSKISTISAKRSVLCSRLKSAIMLPQALAWRFRDRSRLAVSAQDLSTDVGSSKEAEIACREMAAGCATEEQDRDKVVRGQGTGEE